MRRKVRIEELQGWFDDPEAVLNEFMNSGQAILSLMFPGSKRPIELNQRDVGALLIEIRTRYLWDCLYCRRTNPGTEQECFNVWCREEIKMNEYVFTMSWIYGNADQVGEINKTICKETHSLEDAFSQILLDISSVPKDAKLFTVRFIGELDE